MARPVLAHGFETIGLPEVVAEIDAENTGSLRVAEKLGLRGRGRVETHGRVAMRHTLTRAEFGTQGAGF